MTCTLVIALSAATLLPAETPTQPLIRSAQTGAWSSPATWEGGKVPAAGARVQVRTGHTITYDAKSDAVIRSVHVAGTLSFAPDKDTRLDVGLIKIQPGDDPSEDGFNCEAHLAPPPPGKPVPALDVGTRSEERRVGKECRYRMDAVHLKNKTT